MSCDIMDAILKKRPFDYLIHNVRIVNVFDMTISEGSIAIVGDTIALCGKLDPSFTAAEVIDGCGRYALPGFIDSHMHLESSMLTPVNFARLAIANGTTTIVPDPHEIGNVLGMKGVLALKNACSGIPMRVLMMAPSTIPSAPGFEGAGAVVGPQEAEEYLSDPAITGLGEVMDFNGVANGEEPIVSVVRTAAERGCIIDGHASLLTGTRLASFKAIGIDSDHTTPTAAKLREELSMGFTVQIQDCMLSDEMVEALNTVPVFDRICLVTDDVSLDRLTELGHLNHVYAHAVDLGLDPLRAVRFTTINPAVRMRLYRTGAIAPGMLADLQLVSDLRHPKPDYVFYEGKLVFKDQICYHFPVDSIFTEDICHSVHLVRKPAASDFRLTAPAGCQQVTVNIIGQDGRSVRTRFIQEKLPVLPTGEVDTRGYLRMAVYNRYGIDRHGLALIDGFPDFQGAVALTYGHDCHNLTVYGSDPMDMELAANTVADSQGGICYVRNHQIQHHIPLPIAGLISRSNSADLYRSLKSLLSDLRSSGFVHANPMAFFTIMPLAVSPEIKCSDMGLILVSEKRFLPLMEEGEFYGKK